MTHQELRNEHWDRMTNVILERISISSRTIAAVVMKRTQ
jgi:hypothetical protein